jgi:hypothetical protein
MKFLAERLVAAVNGQGVPGAGKKILESSLYVHGICLEIIVACTRGRAIVFDKIIDPMIFLQNANRSELTANQSPLYNLVFEIAIKMCEDPSFMLRPGPLTELHSPFPSLVGFELRKSQRTCKPADVAVRDSADSTKPLRVPG